MQCGLLGQTLSHSYSPQIHSRLGNYNYRLFEIAPEALKDFLCSDSFQGINVTIPYKKSVIPYCSALSDRAKVLGAVNTIVRQQDGSLVGHNTDYYGFSAMLKRSGLKVDGRKVLVLGSGGASATVVAVLTELGADPIVISRSGENNYNNLHKHLDTTIIVNATPVGMYPNTGKSPVDLRQFPNLEGVLDLIYNPARTALLQQAEEMGLVTENGLWMLVAQAKEAAEWFTGTTIADSVIGDIHKELRLQMENIVLVGMPGCGKSTIGKDLAEKLGKTFVDADEEIVKVAGISIPEIFAAHGEAGFREIETQVLARLGKQSGLVIATGGGCVTIPANYNHLHQNSTIFWLQRDINKLPTEGRPLSQTSKLADMYTIRKPLYEQFADIAICNENSVESAVNRIIDSLSGG